jgi:hypothetical protein
MRMPRVRFTVRRMMVGVVIVAIPLASAAWMQRLSGQYRRLVSRYRTEQFNALRAEITLVERFGAEQQSSGEDLSSEEPATRNLLADLVRRGLKPGDTAYQAVEQVLKEEAASVDPDREAARRARVRAWAARRADAKDRTKHFANLVTKYQHAARYPWLPVAPDPPRPISASGGL